MKKRLTGKEIAEYGLLISLAMVLSYVEYMIPFSVAVPGVKLGLANIVVIFALYRLGTFQAFVISLLRVLLMSFMFGNAFALMYSLSGALLSLCIMLVLRKTGRFSPVGVGAAGGVSHNIGQILCAMVLLETKRLIYYLPVLLISGTIAGIVIGVIAGILIKRLDPKQV
ncbi:MAG: Gx transporter family protein [Clostridiales bacterium]|jgi:heptaprenyl diphosphate synthase|nr:Gx transporter family protein [Clostridiales bacterium]